MAVISMKQLLEAGVHFVTRPGDGTLKWLLIFLRSAMASISSTCRKPLKVDEAYNFVRDLAADGGT